MLSKKNQELIENLMSTHDTVVEKEIAKFYKKPAIFEINQENRLSAQVKCYDCGYEGTIDTRYHTSCPSCGLPLSNRYSATYFYNKFILGDDGFTVLHYESHVTHDIADCYTETSLKGIGIMEGNNVTFFEDIGVWTKKSPKDGYYYYGRDTQGFTNLNTEEQEMFKRKFQVIFGKIGNNYRYTSLSLFARPDILYQISEAYKRAVRDKEIVKPIRKKVDKTPEVTIPKITAAMLDRDFPDITTIEVTTEGLIHMATCTACGHKFPLENRYHSPNECPACHRQKANDRQGGYAVAAYPQEENGVLLVMYQYTVKPQYNHGEYKYNISDIKSSCAILVNDDGVFFYEVEDYKATKTTCSEINDDFARFKRTYRYYNECETFIGGADKILKIIEESAMGKIGILEFAKYQVEDETADGVAALSHMDINELTLRTVLASVNYLNIYNNCGAIEQLAKAKMTQLLKDITTKVSCPKFIQKKETTPAKILGISKAQFKEIRDADISQSNFEIYKKILELDPNAAFADCTRFMNRWNMPENVFDILAMNIPKINMREIERYAQSLDDYQCMDWTEGMRLWRDYLNMCMELKCDMNDRMVIFTNNLKLEHDRTVRKHNNIKNKNAIKNFEEAVERYKHLEYQDDEHDFMIIAPKTQEELYEEGRVLHHCVGSYAKSVAEGRSTILFIRSKSKPDSPLCTVEVSNGRLVQARTKYNNAAYTVPGVKKFMQAWAKEKRIILSTR